MSIVGISIPNTANLAFAKRNKKEEVCKRKLIQKQIFCTHAYA